MLGILLPGMYMIIKQTGVLMTDIIGDRLNGQVVIDEFEPEMIMLNGILIVPVALDI